LNLWFRILILLQKADFLSSVGEKTPAFVRFSTVTLGREFPDEARNPRGFAIKLYTTEGNYDIVGLNFVRTQPTHFSAHLSHLSSDSL
jgi:catalase